MYLIVGQGGRLALPGVAVGLLGALVLTRLMASLLYGVGAADPSTYVAVALLLVLGRRSPRLTFPRAARCASIL